MFYTKLKIALKFVTSGQAGKKRMLYTAEKK